MKYEEELLKRQNNGEKLKDWQIERIKNWEKGNDFMKKLLQLCKQEGVMIDENTLMTKDGKDICLLHLWSDMNNSICVLPILSWD
jgi:hypothetical protein